MPLMAISDYICIHHMEFQRNKVENIHTKKKSLYIRHWIMVIEHTNFWYWMYLDDILKDDKILMLLIYRERRHYK